MIPYLINMPIRYYLFKIVSIHICYFLWRSLKHESNQTKKRVSSRYSIKYHYLTTIIHSFTRHYSIYSRYGRGGGGGWWSLTDWHMFRFRDTPPPSIHAITPINKHHLIPPSHRLASGVYSTRGRYTARSHYTEQRRIHFTDLSFVSVGFFTELTFDILSILFGIQVWTWLTEYLYR